MNIFGIIIGLPILIFSAILHEVAHGYVADRLGDPTARIMGRLTLDPRKHIDLYMSILLPALLIISGSPVIFGGAKPVPIDPYNLKDGRKDVALVALAGPATNVALAIAASLLIHLVNVLPIAGSVYTIVYAILVTIFNYNLILAIFNLLPIPPLDGSKLFSFLLPEGAAAAYLSLGQFGIFILLFLLVFPIGGFSLDQFIYTLFNFAKSILGM